MYLQPKRIEFLDSLRGLAALFVLFSHTIGAFSWPALLFTVIKWPFISILFNGKEAVAMFFVLSGYVLSKPYVENNLPPRKIYLPTFYLRRFIRIYPPWFFAFLLSIFGQKILFFQPATQPPITEWLDGFWHAKLTILDFFRQCAFILHDPARQLLIQDWSLGVELKGSALIPLFIVCVRRKNILLVPLLLGLFLMFVTTGHYYVSFIIGTIVAQYDSYLLARLAATNKWMRRIFFMGGLLLYQGYGFFDSPSVYRYGWVITAIGCAIIIISVFSSQTLQQILHCKPFILLGRISYSVYLLQFIVILCLLPPLVAACNNWGITRPLLLFPITLLVGVGVTVGCGALMYCYVEVPVINFGHWLTRKIQRNLPR